MGSDRLFGATTVNMAVPRARILDLMKVQCKIFSTTFNPEALRLGNKVLRRRLKGPALAAYYPRKVATIKDLQKLYPDWNISRLSNREERALRRRRGRQKNRRSSRARSGRETASYGWMDVYEIQHTCSNIGVWWTILGYGKSRMAVTNEESIPNQIEIPWDFDR